MFFKKDQSSKQQRLLNQAAHDSAAYATSHQPEPTFIASDLTIEGNIQTSGELHIDGHITGHVRAEICVVDVAGRVRGQIDANTVYIYGNVEGPIIAQHVQVYAGAVVRSDIYHSTIGIENGADVLGNFMRQDQKLRYAVQPKASTPELDLSEHKINGSPVQTRPNNTGTDFFTQVLGEHAVLSADQSNQSPIAVARPKIAKSR